MTNNGKLFTAGILSVLLGLGTGGAAVGAAPDNLSRGDIGQSKTMDQIDFSSGPVQCEIVARNNNGIVTLQNNVYTLEDISGSYSIEISSYGNYGNANRSSIRQGGFFEVEAESAATLGMMRLGDRGATYRVDLSIQASGHSVSCAASFKA